MSCQYVTHFLQQAMRNAGSAMFLLVLSGFVATTGVTASHAASKVCSKPLSRGGMAKIHVFGDSVARGYWRGLKRAFSKEKTVRVVRRAKSGTGLVREDIYDWHRALRRYGSESFSVGIVSIGGNDRQNFRVNGKRIDQGTAGWKTEYARRVGRFMKKLKATGARFYWVGLPAVRSARMNRDFVVINKIFRKKAQEYGITYIRPSRAFLNSRGRFTAFGRTIKGKKRRLRRKDGIHFTREGNDIMAKHIRSHICPG